MALTTNLVSYWKLDESSGNAADSVGSNTLTNNNTATFSAGKINNGANLASASTQYFSIADASQTGLDLSGDFTFNLWYKLTDLSATYRGLITKYKSDDTALAYSLQVYPNATHPQFILHLSSGGTFGPYETYQATGQGTGAWHMLTISYNATTGVGSWYIDGSSVSPTVSGTMPTSIYNSAEAFLLGKGAGSNGMNGSLDEVGIWNRALSASEVSQLYNGGAGLQYPFSSFIPQIMMS